MSGSDRVEAIGWRALMESAAEGGLPYLGFPSRGSWLAEGETDEVVFLSSTDVCGGLQTTSPVGYADSLPVRGGLLWGCHSATASP